MLLTRLSEPGSRQVCLDNMTGMGAIRNTLSLRGMAEGVVDLMFIWLKIFGQLPL